MSILRSVVNIAQGVAEELQADLRDVAWSLLDILSLRQVFQSLVHELGLHESSSEEFDLELRQKRRNLVRIIGSALPLKPVQRPYLRYVALRSLSTSCDSLFSSTTQNFTETGWGNHYLEKPNLQRKENTLVAWYTNREKVELILRMFPEKARGRHVSYFMNMPLSGFFWKRVAIPVPPSIDWYTEPSGPPLLRRSTLPTHSTSLLNGQNEIRWENSTALQENASIKIAALEEELANLRAQIATILCRSPERPLTPPSSPVPPPPAPPPPPPPPFCPGGSLVANRKSFSELIAQNKDSINQHTQAVEVPSSQRSTEGVCMADVLKGLNKVKLKRVDRSPGGTPIRDRPRSPQPVDAASLIAAALKKRFAKFQLCSPEKEHDSTSGFSSPEETPQTRRKSRRDNHSPEKDTTPTSMHAKQPFILRKISKIPPKPKIDNDQPSLPPFGQHLLKRRVRSPPPKRSSPSSSSENSDLSR